MPLHRRMPKRGFSMPFPTTLAVVNVEIAQLLRSRRHRHPGSCSPSAAWFAASRDGVKILGTGELKVALTVRAHAFSKSAQEKITGAGGKAEVLS